MCASVSATAAAGATSRGHWNVIVHFVLLAHHTSQYLLGKRVTLEFPSCVIVSQSTDTQEPRSIKVVICLAGKRKPLAALLPSPARRQVGFTRSASGCQVAPKCPSFACSTTVASLIQVPATADADAAWCSTDEVESPSPAT